ncbi:MAG: SMP-30/gluconolactonase/LRE family protein [Verrucomicrobiales bacterium]
MRQRPLALLAALLAGAIPAFAQNKKPEPPPEAQRHDGVPQGKLVKATFAASKVFPGTERDYWVYVPAQYKSGDEACLMVFQDGGGYCNDGWGSRAHIVFDNLIHAGEMPVTVGLFVNPGVCPAPREGAQPRFNRSYEYDGMGDAYARFLIEEMIPHAEQAHGFKASANPDDRGICGASSGAIAAFTAAWERPDAFRRVYSMIGTYVGLRGGDAYPTLIRKTEPKPLRIFIEDGENDLNIYGGDWWMANQTMVRALEFSGYEVEHRWSKEGHNHNHGAAIFPEAMRWLWKDHGKAPVATHYDRSKSRAPQYLIDGEGWELVGDGYGWAEGLAAAADGTMYFTDVFGSKIYRVAEGGTPEVFAEDTKRCNGLAMGPDGRLYGAADGGIVAWDLESGSAETVAKGDASNDLVVLHDGTIFYTDPKNKAVWRVDTKTGERSKADDFAECNGIGTSADQTLLYVAHFPGRFIYSYRIGEGGALADKQPYFYMETPPNGENPAFDGMCSAKDGHLVATSAMGIQICDQPGRVQLVLPPPPGTERRTCYAAFGGKDFKTLYVATGDRVFRRKVKLAGAMPWQAPVAPPKPQL